MAFLGDEIWALREQNMCQTNLVPSPRTVGKCEGNVLVDQDPRHMEVGREDSITELIGWEKQRSICRTWQQRGP